MCNSNRLLRDTVIIHRAMPLTEGKHCVNVFKTKSPINNIWTEQLLRRGDSAISELIFAIFRAGKKRSRWCWGCIIGRTGRVLKGSGLDLGSHSKASRAFKEETEEQLWASLQHRRAPSHRRRKHKLTCTWPPWQCKFRPQNCVSLSSCWFTGLLSQGLDSTLSLHGTAQIRLELPLASRSRPLQSPTRGGP